MNVGHLRKCILIPMRGGSKGIPRKNLAPFEGKLLCHHILQTAIDSGIETWVSTDDAEIKAESSKFGVNVLDRPAVFADDDSTDLDVFLHFIEMLPDYDYIVHLRSTYPRMTTKIIHDADEWFRMNYDHCTSLRSMVKATEIPWKMWVFDGKRLVKPVTGKYDPTWMPRQRLRQAFYQNAAIDIIKVDTIQRLRSMTGDRTIPYNMDGMVEDGVDIDNPEDLR